MKLNQSIFKNINSVQKKKLKKECLEELLNIISKLH